MPQVRPFKMIIRHLYRPSRLLVTLEPTHRRRDQVIQLGLGGTVPQQQREVIRPDA